MPQITHQIYIDEVNQDTKTHNFACTFSSWCQIACKYPTREKRTILIMNTNDIVCDKRLLYNLVTQIHLMSKNAQFDVFGMEFPQTKVVSCCCERVSVFKLSFSIRFCGLNFLLVSTVAIYQSSVLNVVSQCCLYITRKKTKKFQHGKLR